MLITHSAIKDRSEAGQTSASVMNEIAINRKNKI